MHFRNYRLQLLLRILLLAITVYVFSRINFNPDYRGTYTGLGFFLVLQVVLLVLYHERMHRQLVRFLNSIRYDDFTELFNIAGEGKVQRELAQQLNAVMQKFREVRAEKEANLHYFEVIVQHIGIGIISYKPDGTILLLNNAAKKLLQVGQARHTRELAQGNRQLTQVLQELLHGEKRVVQVLQGGELINLSVHVIELSVLGDQIRLASVQNIQHELEDKEMEAWHNLIKVLTHEIMNSVTPIASLSASAGEELEAYIDTTAEEITLLREELADISQCLHTISRRSDGLIYFVNDFRNLTSIAVPKLSLFDVSELLQETKLLLREQLASKKVELAVIVPEQRLLLSADRIMIEQILINLVKNALEAVQEQEPGQITISAFHDDRSRVTITVWDNGSGLTPEAASKIFIPFFTTKKTGSGIGLSLSRQIMRLHKGSISVQSELGKGTTFTLKF